MLVCWERHRATAITWSNGMQTSWHQEANHTGRKDIWTPLSTCSVAFQGCLILDCLVAGSAMTTPQVGDVLTGRRGWWRDQRVEVGGLRTGGFVELEKAVRDVCVAPSDSFPPLCSHQVQWHLLPDLPWLQVWVGHRCTLLQGSQVSFLVLITP